MTLITVTAAKCWILKVYCTSVITFILLKPPAPPLPGLHHGFCMRLENHADQSLFNSCPHPLKLAFWIAGQSHHLLQTPLHWAAHHSRAQLQLPPPRMPIPPPSHLLNSRAPFKTRFKHLLPSVAFHDLFQYSPAARSFVQWTYFVLQSLLLTVLLTLLTYFSH